MYNTNTKVSVSTLSVFFYQHREGGDLGNSPWNTETELCKQADFNRTISWHL